MTGLFRKSLGIILLLATVSLATCQSLITTTSETTKITIEKLRGDL